MTATKPYYTVLIEGNIAVGKTTLLNGLIGELNCAVEGEPIERWINCEGHNLLHRMYLGSDDAFVFQVFATYTLIYRSIMRSRTNSNATVRILERSPSSSVRCFGQALYLNGKITDSQLAVLQSMLADWEQRCREEQEIDLVLYLRLDPETATARMQMRDRPEERGVTVDYLRQLHDQHEQLHAVNPYRAKWVPLDATLNADMIRTQALDAIRKELHGTQMQ